MMYDVVTPGLTKERGLTLFELYAANFHMIKLEASGEVNKDEESNSALAQKSGKVWKFLLHLNN